MCNKCTMEPPMAWSANYFPYLICSYDMTPLMLACKKGHTDAINLLLENGADKNKQEKRGYSVSVLLMYVYAYIALFILHNIIRCVRANEDCGETFPPSTTNFSWIRFHDSIAVHESGVFNRWAAIALSNMYCTIYARVELYSLNLSAISQGGAIIMFHVMCAYIQWSTCVWCAHCIFVGCLLGLFREQLGLRQIVGTERCWFECQNDRRLFSYGTSYFAKCK